MSVGRIDGPCVKINVIDAGWSSPVARWAHNPKVAGSNPAPATIDTCSERSPFSGDLLLCTVAPSIAAKFASEDARLRRECDGVDQPSERLGRFRARV